MNNGMWIKIFHNRNVNSFKKGDITLAAEWARKSIHLSTLIFPVAVYHFGVVPVLFGLIPLCAIAVVADILRAYSPHFRRFIASFFGKMMREEEVQEHVFALNGATAVLLSACLTFAIFPKTIAIVAFSILLLGDTCAALFGRHFGKTQIGNTGKSLEGSVAFVLASLLIGFVLPEIGWARLVIAAIVGAIVELAPIPLNDNLRIPLATGVVLWSLP